MFTYTYADGSLVAQRVESACSAGDPSLIPGWEDPLKKETTTHSSILSWRIPWTEEPGTLQSIASQRVGHNPSDLAHRYVYLVKNLII